MHTKDVWVKPKKMIDYINKDPTNKGLYRSFILIKLFIENNAFGKLKSII